VGHFKISTLNLALQKTAVKIIVSFSIYRQLDDVICHRDVKKQFMLCFSVEYDDW